MSKHQPNILSHNTNHNSPLSRQHRQVRQTNTNAHQTTNQGQQQVSRLRSCIKERRLLTLTRKRVNHNVSHTRQRHLSLRQTIQQTLQISKQPSQLRPMLHKTITFTNILRHTSQATQHITKNQLRLRQNQRQGNHKPTQLRSSQRRVTKYTRHRRRNRTQQHSQYTIRIPKDITQYTQTSQKRLQKINTTRNTTKGRIRTQQYQKATQPTHTTTLHRQHKQTHTKHRRLTTRLTQQTRHQLSTKLRTPSRQRSRQRCKIPSHTRNQTPTQQKTYKS